MNYEILTDIDMNSVLIGKFDDTEYKLRDNIKEVFIQGYGDGSFDIIMVKRLDLFNMQGSYFGKNKKAIITGFNINHKTNSVKIHFKTSKKAKSLKLAKYLYSFILTNCLEPKTDQNNETFI